ncbi:MAG: hypothetical protein AAF386_13025, partial [Pseudomonadota bacterium]
MDKRRVLLITPSTFGYENRIEAALRDAGHVVDRIDERFGNDFVSKVAIRLGLARYVPGRLMAHVHKIINQAQALQADTILLLDPETLQGPELEQIMAAVPQAELIIYTWDCAARKPISRQMLDLAAAAYSFDPVDCVQTRDLRHLPLFHTHDTFPDQTDADLIYDFSFIGTARVNRLLMLRRLEKILLRQGQPYFFYLYTQSLYHQLVYRILGWIVGFQSPISRSAVPYSDYLKTIAQTRCVVDIEFADQSGLTMRTFEVVFAGKGILTTNPTLEGYDFYDPARMKIMVPGQTDLPASQDLASGCDRQAAPILAPAS